MNLCANQDALDSLRLTEVLTSPEISFIFFAISSRVRFPLFESANAVRAAPAAMPINNANVLPVELIEKKITSD